MKKGHDLERRGRVLTRKSPAVGKSIASAFVLKDGGLYLVTEPRGDVPEGDPHGFGLYYHDCRFLDGYVLTLDGRAPVELVASAAEGHRGLLELTNPELPKEGGGRLDEHELGVRWDRLLDGETRSLHDVLRVKNFGREAVDLVLALRFRARFEDVFTVRGLIAEPRGTLHPARWAGGSLHLRYDGADGIRRTTDVHFWRRPDETEATTARFSLRVESEGEEEIDLSVVLGESRAAVAPEARPARPDRGAVARARDATAAERRAVFTRVETEHVALAGAIDRSLGDLAMLRSSLADDTFYAAGVPWFVALFGRDALLVALEALAFEPGIAEDTLRLLARHQGTKDDPSRDEQPGKILHELRVGELAHVEAIPQTPYYGAVDSTPLFLVLLAAHAAWTGRLDLFRELRRHVDGALGWIDRAEDEGEGYVRYGAHAAGGLVNQGWKDSGDAIVMADGDLARPPIALVEVQGYVYLARTAAAELYARARELEIASRLRDRAEALRRRFARDFWLPDQGFFALALTGGGPAAVLSSNPGQALWTGIVAPEQARRTAERLLSDRMWSGWGIRTLSTDARRYNPVSYHRGTVWPHDNALIAAGLRRHGLDAEAGRVFQGILDASAHFPMRRLPEVFTGFDRASFGVPVRYPVACHPQAWAAGALPFMLTSLLGLTPEAFDARLRVVRPALPSGVERLALRGLRVGDGSVDLVFARGAGGEVRVEVPRVEGGVTVVA